MIAEIVSIEKEKISGEKFISRRDASFCVTPERTHERMALLQKAVFLGNAHRHKVRIIFETIAETKQVETTIWAIDDLMIYLKGGVMIPIHAISEVVI